MSAVTDIHVVMSAVTDIHVVMSAVTDIHAVMSDVTHRCVSDNEIYPCSDVSCNTGVQVIQ